MAHRHLRVGEIPRDLQGGAGGNQCEIGAWFQLGAQGVAGGHQRRLEGDHGLAVGDDRGVAGDLEQPDRLDRALAGLGRHHAGAGQDLAGGVLSVDWVALALQAPLALAGRAGNLQHHDGMTAQEPGQPEPVGAGAFHPERRHPTQPGRPGEQVGVAGRGR
jgi:hypothetical protein